jgi:hypothetical protein
LGGVGHAAGPGEEGQAGGQEKAGHQAAIRRGAVRIAAASIGSTR